MLVSRSDHLIYHFSITIFSTSLILTRKYTFEKITIAGEMLIEQTIEFELRGPGASGRTFIPITGYFHDKTKVSKKVFEWIIIY